MMSGGRDVGLRSKRLTREMQTYWRKHEKEVTETRKKSAKEEADRRKREQVFILDSETHVYSSQEVREVERQQKKLEFLLKQTELFSHFIGKKMGLSDDQEVPEPDHLPETQIETAQQSAQVRYCLWE